METYGNLNAEGLGVSGMPERKGEHRAYILIAIGVLLLALTIYFFATSGSRVPPELILARKKAEAAKFLAEAPKFSDDVVERKKAGVTEFLTGGDSGKELTSMTYLRKKKEAAKFLGN